VDASEQASKLIAQYEGFSSKAYPDPGSGDEPWTIGYGTTVYHDGVKVVKGDTISREDALMELEFHVNEVVVPELNDMLEVAVTQNQFDALVSFAYNVGIHQLASSTLLKLTNAGDVAGAAKQFARWNKSSGRVMAGLVRRRATEAQLFVS